MCQGNIFEKQVLVLCLVLRAEMVMEFFKHLGKEKLIKKNYTRFTTQRYSDYSVADSFCNSALSKQ